MNRKTFSLWALALAGLGWVAGCSTTNDNQCGAGLVECNGDCVNDKAHPSHCGGCGIVCESPQVCNAGSCSDSCAGNFVACGRSCVDLSVDAENCGGCGTKCNAGASCVAGKCTGGNPPDCKDRMPFSTSGSYDLDAKVVQVSGKLTKNGAAVPDGASRGYLTFESKKAGNRSMPQFAETGEATYQGSLFAGLYDVYFNPSYSCRSDGPMPCQRMLLRSGVDLAVSGSLDFDVKTVQVSGKLTKNGGAVPSGTNRGYLVFELKQGGAKSMPSFKESGEATYQGEVFAGMYDIRYQNSSSCDNERGALPCQSIVVQEGVNLNVGGSLDLNVKTVTLSGRLSKNGARVPDGTNRGYLSFELKQGSARSMAAFKATGEATYQGELFVGTYDVLYRNSYYCNSGDALPCANHLLRSGLAVTTSGSLDFDAKTVQVSGKLTKNGARVPSGSNRGSVRLEQLGGTSISMPAFGDTGEATFQSEIFAGTYDVLYEPSYYCSKPGALPCHRVRLRAGVPLNASGSLDVDAKTVQVSGKFTKNGAAVPDGANRGYLLFAHKDGGSLSMPGFGDAGDATYQGEVFAGNFDVTYQPSYYCGSAGPLPCQAVRLRSDLGLSVSGSIDFDAKTVSLSGKLTKNGQKVPDGGNRGLLRFTEKSGNSRSMPSFAESGEATYQGELFAGEYSIFYVSSYSCNSSSPMPCQTALLVGCPATP